RQPPGGRHRGRGGAVIPRRAARLPLKPVGFPQRPVASVRRGVHDGASSRTRNSGGAVMGTQTPVLEPRTQAFIDSLAAAGGPPLYALSPDAARAVLVKVQEAPVDKVSANIEDTTFPGGPTG